MKKIIPFLISALLLLVQPLPVMAQDQSRDVNEKNFETEIPIARTGDTVTISEGEVIDKNFYLTAGETVEIFGTVNGDLYVAGGQVLVDGTVNGDLYVAGGVVTVSGEITQDAVVFGGQIDVSGTVGQNLTVAGGNITIAPSAQVEGGLLVAGGNVNLLAPVNGDIAAGVGNLVISSNVGGDVYAGTGELRLTPQASIQGNLEYTSESEANISEQATVSGTITQKDPVTYGREDFDKAGESVAAALASLGFIVKLIRLVSWMVLGIVLILLFPNWFRATKKVIDDRGWAALGIGLAAVILTPAVILILLITVLGIPLGLLLLLAYIILLSISRIITANWLGDWVANQFGWELSIIAQFLIGLLLLGILLLIPVIGGLIGFIAMLLGVGSMLITEFNLYEKLREEKVI